MSELARATKNSKAGSTVSRRPAVDVARAISASSADRSEIRSILSGSGIQAKTRVGPAADAFESEADRVAEKVAANQPAPLISRLPSAAADTGRRVAKPVDDERKKLRRKAVKEDEDKKLQRKARPEEEKKPVQRAVKRDDEDAKKVRRKIAQPDEEKKKPVQRAMAAPKKTPDDEKKLQRAIRKDDEDQQPVQRTAGTQQDNDDRLSDAADRAIAAKGAGRPLDSPTRSRLESNMGVDLSGVRVHDDVAARAAAQSLNARAFTHGNDIWLGPGESQSDTRLMAHEATHVVQQQSGMLQRVVQRDEGDAPELLTPEQKLRTFKLPRIKARHKTRYDTWASSRKLVRTPGDPFNRGTPNQIAVWRNNVVLPPRELLRLHLTGSFTGNKTLKLDNNATFSGTRQELLDRLQIPDWDDSFTRLGHPFEVDHIIELQVGNWGGPSGTLHANQIDNMELSDKSSNASAGGSTLASIRRGYNSSVREYLRDSGRPSGSADASEYLKAPKLFPAGTPLLEGIRFDRVELRSDGRDESDVKIWTRVNIERGDHLRRVYPLANAGEHGRADSYALVSPSGTLALGEYQHPINSTTIDVINENDQRRIKGIRITQIQLNSDYATAAAGAQVGTLQATFDPAPDVHAPAMPLALTIRRVSQYSGYVDGLPSTLAAETPALSPIEFTDIQLDGRDLSATGRLSPTVPLLSQVPLELRLRGRDIELAYTYNTGELALPIPGVNIEDSSLSIFYGTRGFGAEGEVDFNVDQLCNGSLSAAISTEHGFEASGQMRFDTELFDRADINVSYRNGAFGGGGTLGITNPDKVRGIRSAEITVAYDAGTFSASGRVSPSIPGVQEAALTVSYSETEGLLIGGTLALSENRVLRSGSLEAQVRKRPGEENYSLSAHGTAQPAIPGIDSTLTVDYNDGAFTAQASASYSRGMLSGSLEVGATNRVVGEDGQLTDEIGEDLRAFGGGQLTLQVAPWLQATAGVRILPNAEIEVQGEIGLPSQLEIFPRKQIDKSLLNIAIQVPIAPGIVAEIGGGLDAQAGIGPGVIDQLSLRITYNPAHEENTLVTGDAHLNIPADAGLRLAVRAGIGLGITGASATGGLEIGGMLGIGGAAEAGVHVEWSPSTGLRIDAYGELHAEPVFRFDIGGYVSVRVLGLSVYDNSWEFASYEYGSNMRFGVRFPIHYIEGQPFDISLDDVEFTVPDINPGELLRGLVNQIT